MGNASSSVHRLGDRGEIGCEQIGGEISCEIGGEIERGGVRRCYYVVHLTFLLGRILEVLPSRRVTRQPCEHGPVVVHLGVHGLVAAQHAREEESTLPREPLGHGHHLIIIKSSVIIIKERKRVLSHASHSDMVITWGDGGEIAGRWRGDGGEMAGR